MEKEVENVERISPIFHKEQYFTYQGETIKI